MLRRLASVLVFASWIVGCEAVIGDVGGYSNLCNPVADKCPATAPCSFDLATSSFKCTTRLDTNKEDNTCKDEGDCDRGLGCVQPSDTAESKHCQVYCLDKTQCATSGSDCKYFPTPRKTLTGLQVGFCGPLDPPCAPVGATSSCGSNSRCQIWDNDDTRCEKLVPMPKSTDDQCEFLDECPQGTLCYTTDPSTSSTRTYYCRQMCDVATPSCSQFSCSKEIFSLGSQKIGLCLP